ncbi:ATP-dependent helicase [Patescibacteria group bacterium]|nr:ATP-dependent helicase [Patescibacteria group bacterium]
MNKKKFEDRLNFLNKKQKEAVDNIYGPLLVVAGPGTGKTELLGVRVANILDKTDTTPSSILCLTFTESASINMRERLTGLIGKDAYKVNINTFHAFCSEVINRYPEFFYNGATYRALEDIRQIEIIEKIIIKKLNHNSNFRKKVPSQGYTYIKDILNRIKELKKAGIRSEEFLKIIEENHKFEIEFNKLLDKYLTGVTFNSYKKVFSLFNEILKEAYLIKSKEEKIKGFEPLKNTILRKIELAIEDAEEIEKTGPLTKIKKDLFVKSKEDTDKFILKSSANYENYLDLAIVYQEYKKECEKLGFFDFEDMIIDVVSELENNDELKYNLQEQYQFILIDEFQDTNYSQMEIIRNLTDNKLLTPNVMAVGDDDQSIYKFQGASMKNMADFIENYKDTKVIILDENYRSTSEILEYSRNTIEFAEDRLVNIKPEFTKVLKASNSKIKKGNIKEVEFNSENEEYLYIALKIKEIPKNESIAIISRTHKYLEKISKILDQENIDFEYEKNSNLSSEKNIKQILTIIKFLDSVIDQKIDKDYLLPEILTYEFFGVSNEEIWKFAEFAKNTKNWNESWFSLMKDYDNEKIKAIFKFFKDLSAEVKRKTAEEILDYIIGNTDLNGYRSNYKEYYFSSFNNKKDKLNYLVNLLNLQGLFTKIREYSDKDTLYIDQIVRFIELYEEHKMNIEISDKIKTGDNNLVLLSAHKAKGLEFDNVFIIHCNSKEWDMHKNDKIQFPTNMPLSAEKDDLNDKSRLFYVAETRAKSNLYLTRSIYNKDREQERLSFLYDPKIESEIKITDENYLAKREEIGRKIYLPNLNNYKEKELIKPFIEDYKLSVTHLQNFIDLNYGGPESFLENSLFKFPKAKNAQSSYGTSIHNTFKEFYNIFAKHKELPKTSLFIKLFEKNLKLQRLNPDDFKNYHKKGEEELKRYYKINKNKFNYTDIIERDFKNQGVEIDDCILTGKIDRFSINKEEKIIKVFDYKTGKIFRDWNKGLDETDKMKAFKYKNQLVFYKLLIENSKDYNKYEVLEGEIEFLSAKNERNMNLLYSISEEDVIFLKKLIKAIYTRIVNLDFPDTSSYSPTYSGSMKFIEDLIK